MNVFQAILIVGIKKNNYIVQIRFPTEILNAYIIVADRQFLITSNTP